jgi:hypothetical protein
MVGCLWLAIHFHFVGQLSCTAANLDHDIRFDFMLSYIFNSLIACWLLYSIGPSHLF